MSHDFVKPKKIGGLDTNSHTGQRSPFASRPFLATPRSQPQPQDIQTMRERAARYQAANPHLYGTPAQPQTVQRQASETEEESLQMKVNESVQRKPEQPDLQTLIRQRAARADTPLQRMMKVQMAQAQSLEQEKDDLQMRKESSVQREAMPEEQEEKKPEDIQAKAESQPEDLEKEEDIPPVQAKTESEPEDLEKKPEDIQPKLNSTVQAQEDLDKEKPEDLQAKADSQPEDLEEEDSTPVQTKAEPTETLEEETKLQEKQELNVQSQPSQQEEEVELQQKVNQAIQQQKLDEQKKDAQLQTRIDRSIQRQKLNKDRDQGHLQQQINHAVQHQELETQQEETQLQRRINRAIQKQKARKDEDILKAPPAKTQSVRPKSFQTKLQNKLQTKLTVGKPGDKYEQEADKVAAKVMAMPETQQKIPQETELAPKQEEPEVQMRSLANSITSVGQGQLAGDPQSVVQNKEGQSSTQPGLESCLASQQGQGSPLPDETRNFMESRFGADFGNVRVHTGSQSVQMNKELGAQAFTHGNDVYFNSGKFNPGSSSGKELLAHELTHTIQQMGGKVQKKSNKLSLKLNTISNLNLQARKAEETETLESADRNAESQSEPLQQFLSSPQNNQPNTSENNQATQSPVMSPPIEDPSTSGGDQAQKAEQEQETSEKQDKSATSEQTAADTPPTTDDTGASTGTSSDSKTSKSAETKATDEEQIASQASTAATSADASNTQDGVARGEAGESASVPASPEQDPDYQAVVAKSKGVAKQKKQHNPASSESKAAQDAAVSPDSEVKSQAQNQQVGEMAQQEPGTFDAASFKAAVMEKVEGAAPKTLEDADKFQDRGLLGQIKDTLSGKAKETGESAAAPIKDKAKEAPDTSGIEKKPVTPLSPPDVGSPPPDLGAGQATPKSKPDSEVSAPMQAESKNLDQKMAEADVTEEQLANSNEPEFVGALNAKQEAQTKAVEAPKAYRLEEQSLLTTAQSESQTIGKTQAEGMQSQREAAMAQLKGVQGKTKGKDEQKRAEVANHINGIYENTKTAVDGILGSLENEVMTRFGEGAERARAAYEDYVAPHMEEYKRRYDGIWGKGRWVSDQLLGVPSEVTAFFNIGRNKYLKEMNATLTDLANYVTQQLNEAKEKIKQGKQEIQEYVAGLPAGLKQVGQEAADNIQSQFDELEQSVDEKHSALIDALAQAYNKNLKELDARIAKMKASNQPWFAKAMNSLTGVIETINKLKDMLLSVLGKAASVIGSIIKDPIGFLGNLISGIKQGFDNFVGNIGKHLQAGLIGWLTGTLGPMGIQLPDDIFSLPGIFSLVTQVLGVTFGHIRQKAVKRFGEPVVAGMEQSVEVFQVLRDRGAMGLWEQAQEQFSDLKETVIGEIKNMVITQVITAGVKWILSLLNPASAFVKAAMAIYDIIMFFVNRGSQVLELVNAVVDAVAAIAKGAVGGAAKLVENALARALPVVIGFLASLAGVGGLAKKVEGIIGKVRKRIDRAIDKVLLKARKLFKKTGKKGKEKLAAIIEWWKAKKKFTAKDGEAHTLFFEGTDKNAKLIIASKKRSYEEFINDIDVDNQPDPIKRAKTEATTIAKKIDKISKKRRGRGKGVQTSEGQKIKQEIISELNKLTIPTSILAAASTSQPPSVVEYGDLISEGGGTYMNAKILSKNNVEGYRPQDKPNIWEKANRRKGVYVQGHLLNENLGGPGKAYNLSPITDYTNKQHLKFVEKYVKKAVLDQKKVVRYRVNVVYHKHPKRSSQKAIEDRLNNGTSTDLNKDQRKLDIMKYEQEKLPRAFVNQWATLKYNGTKWVDDEVKPNLSVPNNLPDSEPDI